MNMDQLEIAKRETYRETPGKWFALLYLFWIGGASSISWGSIVNSLDYFEAKFPNDDVSFRFPLAPYFANLILLAMITYLSKVISYKVRIIIALIAMMALEIIIPFQADWFANSEGGFWSMMGLLLLMGFFSNMCYASICGFTSQVGGKYTACFMIGVACFGLVMNLTKEGTLLIYQNDSIGDITSNIAYFGLTFFFMLVGLILHIIFMKSRFYHVELKNIVDPSRTSSEDDTSVSPLRPLQQPVTPRPKKDFKTLFSIFIDGWLLISLMFLANLQHNTFYPGVMLLKPMPALQKTAKTVSLVTTFNVFYIVGKFLGQYRSRYNLKIVAIIVLIRFIFDALLILQVVEPNAAVLGSYWFAYVNIAMFSTTLGFLIVALFIMIPEQFPSEKKELAGFVAVIGNNVGTMCGAFLALTLANLSP